MRLVRGNSTEQPWARHPLVRRAEAGFTLVEMLVVLAIIGMLTGLIGPQVMNYLSRAKADTGRVEIQNLEVALDLFRLDVGRYPTEREGLVALVERPSGIDSWAGPYLKKRVLPTDPWGKPFGYHSPGRSGAYDIVMESTEGSAGANAAEVGGRR